MIPKYGFRGATAGLTARLALPELRRSKHNRRLGSEKQALFELGYFAESFYLFEGWRHQSEGLLLAPLALSEPAHGQIVARVDH